MLVLKRKEGQWVEIRHSSGDLLRIKVYDIRDGQAARCCNLAFDDDARNFEITRPERVQRDPATSPADDV